MTSITKPPVRHPGLRKNNLGLTTRHIRYQAICLHLNHSREYWREGENVENLSKLGETIRTRRIRTARGIAEADDKFTVDSFGRGAETGATGAVK